MRLDIFFHVGISNLYIYIIERNSYFLVCPPFEKYPSLNASSNPIQRVSVGPGGGPEASLYKIIIHSLLNLETKK